MGKKVYYLRPTNFFSLIEVLLLSVGKTNCSECHGSKTVSVRLSIDADDAFLKEYWLQIFASSL